MSWRDRSRPRRAGHIDPTVVDYVLLDEYLRTFELFGCSTVNIAGVCAVMDKSCVTPYRSKIGL